MIFLTHEFAPFRGGAATYVQETAAAAARLGFPVEVWTVDRRQPAAGIAEADEAWDFPVVRLPASGRLSPGGIYDFARGLYQRRERLRGKPLFLLSVGAHMAFGVLQGFREFPASGAIGFFHGSEILRFYRWLPWGGMMRRLYARSGGFAVASRYVQGLLGASGLLPGSAEIALAPCACPVALQRDFPRSIDELDGRLRILTAARLHPRKGQVEVATALGRLPGELRRRAVYQMVGVGEESYRRQIEAACRAGGVACEFLGGLSDEELARAYARCDIYAQTSRALPRSVEGFGISYLEASYHGRPVAAYDTGGVSEAVVDQETGLLAPEGDVGGLASILERLATDASLRRRLGENGRRFARRFSWEEAARVLYGMAGSM
jgi:phosphatidylinositol alpha-1,6-mannosyltransferase